MMHDPNTIVHLNPRRYPILNSVFAQVFYRLALFPRGSALLERNAVLFLYLTYHLPSIRGLAVSNRPVRYWQEMIGEVDAKVEIGDCFGVMLVVYTGVVVIVPGIPGMGFMNDTSVVFSMRPIDVQGKSGRLGGV